jgi:hypothetical protein
MGTPQIIPANAMGTAEIIKKLGTPASCLSKLRKKPDNTMPPPINTDNKFYLYDRKVMQAWIDKRLALKAEAAAVAARLKKPSEPGLDNSLAQHFLRRPLQHGR